LALCFKEIDMLQIDSPDICSINTFPLLWRWNQISHAILLDEEIKLIEPLVENKSNELLNLVAFLKEKNYQNEPYLINTEGSNDNVITLLNNLSLKNELVFVSWEKYTAVRMPLSLFIHRWSDFCYPSSDDVSILPISGNWLLEYWHYERFTWYELNAT
jgi:hypothetical protein